MTHMMGNNKLAPIEFENKILGNYLYSRVDRKWQHSTKFEKKTREGALANIMPELTNNKKTTFLEKYRN